MTREVVEFDISCKRCGDTADVWLQAHGGPSTSAKPISPGVGLFCRSCVKKEKIGYAHDTTFSTHSLDEYVKDRHGPGASYVGTRTKYR